MKRVNQSFVNWLAAAPLRRVWFGEGLTFREWIGRVRADELAAIASIVAPNSPCILGYEE